MGRTSPPGGGDPGAPDPERTGEGAGGGGPRLLVLEPGSSSLRDVPSKGLLVVGSGPDAGLRVEAPGVASRHAALSCEPGRVEVSPLEGSFLVNGEAAAGPVVLSAGDVLSVGEVTLVVQQEGRPALPSPLDAAALRVRLLQETERSARTGRPLAVLVLAHGDPARARSDDVAAAVAPALRVEDLACSEGSETVVVMPDTGRAAIVPAGRLLAALATLGPAPRAGLALCPDDGLEPGGLLAAARLAARRAAPGEVATAATAVEVLAVGDERIVVASPSMRGLFDLVRRLARSDMPVLVTGETGVGKEVVARALHEWSPRGGRRLVTLNCAAITEGLFESELFGHERGAFTGAVGAKPGLLEVADGSSILLDEIGECSPGSQAKLLRVVETGEATRVGGLSPRVADVRVIAATNRELEAEVEAGRFRRDLLYRLGAATVVVPPLRERGPEVPVLARHFLAGACAACGRASIEIAPATMQRLCLHPWPGNVRELRNLMDYLAATVEGSRLEPEQLPEAVAASAPPWKRGPSSPAGPAPATVRSGPPGPPFRSIKEEVEELERTRIAQALAASAGVRVRAAALIGMPLRTFVTKLGKYGFGGEEPRGGHR